MSDKELILEIIKTLERIDINMDSINITLVRQEENLKNHMKRSDALEAHVKALEETVVKAQNKILKAEGALSFIGVLAVILGIIAGFVELF
ncbi:MAG: hypothetical protein HC836_47380 [Richelia sp. RM2_1_2]|nr:hypothetical protein [Richelia sp. RM2_1_2]